MAPQIMPYRASFRQANGPFRPTTFGSTASAGSRTSSRVMSHWMEARIDSFGSMAVAVNPGVSVGTTNPRIPSSVCAQITATDAMDAKPIHRLAPVSTQSDPSLRA
jgi:hypothetical protein